MRIAHITATFPPYQAGTGNVCFYNSRELSRLGHDVHVFTAARPNAATFEILDGVQVHRLKPFFQIGNAPLLPDLIRIRDFDIIHLHYPFIFGEELIWLISKLRNIPYVLTHHNDLIGKGIRLPIFDTYTFLTARLIFTGAKRLLTVSKGHAVHCQLAGLFEDRWEEVIEIPNGVDIDLFRPGYERASIRRELGIPENARVILFIGALDRAHHYKNIPMILKALAQISDQKVWLLLIGDGDLLTTYRHQASTLGISDRTVFAGSRQHRELPQTIAAGDLLILPSSAESFGMVLIEAMACGLPVIASDLPGIRMVVTDDEDGILIEPGNRESLVNALQGLLFDEAACKRMGEAGRQKVVTCFSWREVVKALERVYQSVLDGQ